MRACVSACGVWGKGVWQVGWGRCGGVCVAVVAACGRVMVGAGSGKGSACGVCSSGGMVERAGCMAVCRQQERR